MPEEILGGSGEIDIEAFTQQFEAEYTETDPEVEPDTNAEEVPGAQGDVEGDPQGDDLEEDPEVGDNPADDPDVHKRNEAFKRQREEIKELSRYRDFVSQMAKDNGFEDPTQIFEAYQQQSLAKEAEERGIDMDTMQEIDAARRQEQQRAIEESQQSFHQEREATIEKFGLSEEDVQHVHDYVLANGFQELGFEQAYKLANFDSFVEKAKNEGRQNYLSDKKKRQQSAAINPGSNSISNSDASNGDGLSDDEFQSTLKAMGVDLD